LEEWEVEFTNEFGVWWEGFDRSRANRREGRGEPPLALRTDIGQAPCGLRKVLETPNMKEDEHLETLRNEGLFIG
jgi:hypothetical protein